jgi:hypothetical protein
VEEQLAALQFLVQEIGPRPPTSAAEAQAAAYVNSRMRQAGLDVEVQTFRAVPRAGLPYGIICLALVLTPLVYYFYRPAALALSLLALLVLVLEILSFPVLSALLPLGHSQNVIATRPAAREASQRLIVLAHLDSPRPSLFFHPRLVGSLRRIFWLTLAAMAALPVLAGLGWWLDLAGLWYAQWAPAAYLLLILAFLVHGEFLTRTVPGANNNASGLVVLLRLADELQGLQQTDLWLVATGGKEAGLHGARQFLRHYPFPPESTYIVNLDSVGQGQLSLVVREGLLWSQCADPYLVEIASRTESDDISVDADPRVYHLTRSDACVAQMRRLRAMSVMALVEGRPAHLHWPSDTLEHIQPQLLERATRLVAGLARRLDRGSPSCP